MNTDGDSHNNKARDVAVKMLLQQHARWYQWAIFFFGSIAAVFTVWYQTKLLPLWLISLISAFLCAVWTLVAQNIRAQTRSWFDTLDVIENGDTNNVFETFKTKLKTNNKKRCKDFKCSWRMWDKKINTSVTRILIFMGSLFFIGFLILSVYAFFAAPMPIPQPQQRAVIRADPMAEEVAKGAESPMVDLLIGVVLLFLGFAIGILTPLIGMLQRLVFGPNLKPDFKKDPFCFFSTPKGKPPTDHLVDARVKVINTKKLTARGCRGFLTKIEKQDESGDFETLYRDSIPLKWSFLGTTEGLDIPHDVDVYLDVLKFVKGKEDFEFHTSKLPKMWKRLSKETGIYRFTIVVIAEQVKTRRIKLILDWSEIWTGNWESLKLEKDDETGKGRFPDS